jgi:predicted TIM-barrel enzyme
MVHFNNLFRQNKPVIAMVHLMALPGTPANSLKPAEIIQMALNEAENYVKYGVDAIMIENMHDRPYLKTKATPECISLMSIIGYEIKKQFNIPVGIQILAAANIDAIAAALGAGLGFIRAEGFFVTSMKGYLRMPSELMLYGKISMRLCHLSDIKKNLVPCISSVFDC